MARPAYRRLEVQERRRQLLERGAELFTRHSYDELSMRKIAREAGISKALLYHYFPSKRALFQATLAQAAEELRARTEPDPNLPPLDQLKGSLEAFLGLIDENALAYRKLMQSATSVPEVRELVDEIRTRTAQRILEGLFPDGAPVKARIAVHGWLWFMDGACLDWIEHRDLSRGALRDLLLGTLLGALAAADAVPRGVASQPAASTNLDLVRSLYAAWERGDWSSAEWADPEIEFIGADGPDPVSVRGVDKLGEAWAEFLDAWEDYRVEAEEYRELDDERVLALIRISGRGKTSGLEVGRMRTEAANLFHIRDGKVTRLVLYWDRERALSDVGLAQETDSQRS